MKKGIFLLLVFNSLIFMNAQEIINLPIDMPTEITWHHDEKEYYSDIWKTQVITNVSIPTMQVFSPARENNTGTAVIIAPGGGLYAHSINTEGNDVATWLTKKGITAFVLKYRLVPTGEDGVAEISLLGTKNPSMITEKVSKMMPFSISDGLTAVAYVRTHAKKYGINPKKIGFMGFSAGGAVAMGIAYSYTAKNRPDFLVPVYPWTTQMDVQKPKKDAPPMLVICASDDPLDLASGAIELYNSWHNEGLNAGIHMYAKGGHGFGMRKNGLPSDTWIERFYDWSITEELVSSKK